MTTNDGKNDRNLIGTEAQDVIELRTARWRAHLFAGELLAQERNGEFVGQTVATSVIDETSSPISSQVADDGRCPVRWREADESFEIENLPTGLKPVCIWEGCEIPVMTWQAESFEFDLNRLMGVEDGSNALSWAAAGDAGEADYKTNARFGFVAVPYTEDGARRLRLQLVGAAQFEGKAIVEIRVCTEDASRSRSESATVPIFRQTVDLTRGINLQPSEQLTIVRQRLQDTSVRAEIDTLLPPKLPKFPRALLLVRPMTGTETVLEDGKATVEMLEEKLPGVYSVDRTKNNLGLGRGRLDPKRGFLLTLAESGEQFRKVSERIVRLTPVLDRILPDPDDYSQLVINLQKSIRAGNDTSLMDENAELSAAVDRYLVRAAARQRIQGFRQRRQRRSTSAEPEDEQGEARSSIPLSRYVEATDESQKDLPHKVHHVELIRHIVTILPTVEESIEYRAAWLLEHFGTVSYAEVAAIVGAIVHNVAQAPLDEAAKKLVDRSPAYLRQARLRTKTALKKHLQREGWLDAAGEW